MKPSSQRTVKDANFVLSFTGALRPHHSMTANTSQSNSVEQTAIRTTYFSILGNMALAIIKALSGVLGNSYALIADAIESTSDIFASLLVLMGIKYASKPPDANHPYGHGRVEPLITFLVVAFMVGSALIITYDSINNILHPGAPPKSWTLLVLLPIILWKEYSFRKVLRKSKQTHSTTLEADAWHHRSDAISSLAAFIGISIALIGGKGYESADDWSALVAAGIILYNAYGIFRPALSEIMDEHLYDELIMEVREVAKDVQGITSTEKCMIRKAGMYYHVDLHARVNGELTVHKGHELAHQLKDTLHERIPNLGQILIHIEPEVEG